MRFIMLVKGDEDYERGAPPPPALMAAIGALGEEMVKSGNLLEMGGLAPSVAGALLNLESGAIRVTDGPFAESKEVIGGYPVRPAFPGLIMAVPPSHGTSSWSRFGLPIAWFTSRAPLSP